MSVVPGSPDIRPRGGGQHWRNAISGLQGGTPAVTTAVRKGREPVPAGSFPLASFARLWYFSIVHGPLLEVSCSSACSRKPRRVGNLTTGRFGNLAVSSCHAARLPDCPVDKDGAQLRQRFPPPADRSGAAST